MLTNKNRETLALILRFAERDAQYFILRLQVLDLARQPLHLDLKLAHLAGHGSLGGRRRRAERVRELSHR